MFSGVASTPMTVAPSLAKGYKSMEKIDAYFKVQTLEFIICDVKVGLNYI